MTYEKLKQLKLSDLKRRCGAQRETFEQMTDVLRPHLELRGKRGGQCKLSVKDQLPIVVPKAHCSREFVSKLAITIENAVALQRQEGVPTLTTGS